jgi:ABC-type nitrate/sulfonate/bicarbonate transport system ATPase subunit
VSQIDVRHITQEYDTGDRRITALRDVSFTVGTSEFVCVLGQSGCGKTTLLNLLAGFLAPTQGEILVGGQAVSGKGGDRGIVFQDFAQLFPWRTAQRNVEFGLEMRNVPAAERRETALRFLRLVKLEPFASAYPHQLSGGMQQRVAIARALAYEPSVLLMDEPFAALDAMTREEMQRLLVEVWQKTRKTVVYVTHNVAEAVYLADRIVILTPHPGMVKTELKITLPRMRDPLQVEVLEYQREVIAHLTGSPDRP